MATTDPTPEVPAAAPPKAKAPAAAAPVPPEPVTPALVVAEYIGESERTYHWPGAPTTVRKGDICAVPELPEDGYWKAAPGCVITRLPDNHPDNSPGAPDWENVAHTLDDRAAILARLGIDENEVQK